MMNNTGQHDQSGSTLTWVPGVGALCSTHGPDHVTLLADPNDGDNAWWTCSLDGAATLVLDWH